MPSKKRGELDGTPDIVDFAAKIEAAAIETVENGIMTGDLLLVADPGTHNRKVSSTEFIDTIKAKLEKRFD